MLPKDGHGHRLDFGHFIDRGFWIALISISTFGVREIGQLSDNVHNLNETVVVIAEKVNSQDKRSERQALRMDKIEERVHYLEIAPHSYKRN